MTYSEALEQQVALWRWLGSPAGKAFGERAFGDTTWLTWCERSAGIADTYYISREIENVLLKSSEAMPLLRPTGGMLPNVQRPGFMWLEEPWNTGLVGHDEGGSFERFVHGFIWGLGLFNQPGEIGLRVVQVAPLSTPPSGTRIIIIPLLTDNPTHKNVAPWSFFEWDWAETQQDAVNREGIHAERYGSFFNADFTLRCYELMAALWLFLQQHILVSASQTAERHARKRIERQGWTEQPLVRVIQLRRREPVLAPERNGESAERDWSCRWVVRGHWRQQFYPSKHANLPIWITPYVKGPEEKPLKPPRATVFAVVR